jgi:FkbM family methyltransferase
MGLLRKLIEAPLRAAGVEPIPKWQLSSFTRTYVHAELLREIFADRQVDCVFDVGAFDGHFGRFLREAVGFGGWIFSFEPQPSSYEALAKCADSDTRWKVFHMALGDCSGELKMNVMKKPWFSSFLEPSARMPASMIARNAIEQTVRVPVERLSDRYVDLAREFGFERPFLKMDTQGYDLRVLEGAKAHIDLFVGLQSEVSVIPIYDGMPPWQLAIDKYTKAGFALSGMFAVSHDERQRAVEFDAVMVRAESASQPPA